MTFTIVPALASDHADRMTACDITSAAAPTIQKLRGDATIITALATTSSPAVNHATPISCETGWVSCGSSA